MKIDNSFGPNPRALRMFLAEKGINIPMRDVDLMAAENRRPPYTDRNPGGQLPALELEDGKVRVTLIKAVMKASQRAKELMFDSELDAKK